MESYNFNVTAQEANIILQALGELPGRICIPVINKLQQQVMEQQKGFQALASAEEQKEAA